MDTPSSDHRKGCQCHMCVHPKLTVVYSCMSCGAGPAERSEDIQHNSWCRKAQRGPSVPQSIIDAAEAKQQLFVHVPHNEGDLVHPDIDGTPHADAAQGGVTTNPDGSIAYRHVPIVEEKQK